MQYASKESQISDTGFNYTLGKKYQETIKAHDLTWNLNVISSKGHLYFVRDIFCLNQNGTVYKKAF